jgi:hypothetical protein
MRGAPLRASLRRPIAIELPSTIKLVKWRSPDMMPLTTVSLL